MRVFSNTKGENMLIPHENTTESDTAAARYRRTGEAA